MNESLSSSAGGRSPGGRLVPVAVPPPRRRSTRWVARVLAPVLMFVALAAWGFSSAPRSSPDDNFHLASIWCTPSVGTEWCRPGPDAGQRMVPEGVVDRCSVFQPEVSAACRGAGEDESLLDDQYVATSWANFNDLYPPVFYSAMALFASDDLSTSVAVMRTVNAALFVLLLTAVVVAVPPGLRVSVVLAAVATLIPLGAFIIPSTNPSSWALLSSAALWPALLGHLRTSGVRSVVLGALAVLAAVMGAGARADAAVFAVLAVMVAALLADRRLLRWWHAVVPLVVVAAAAALYLSAGQGSDGLDGVGDSQEPLTVQLVRNNVREIPQLWAGILGTHGLGWLDTPMPGATWVLAGSACAAVVWWGMGATTVRKSLAVVGAFAALWLVPLVLLVQSRLVVPEFVQPRYLMPLLIILVGVAVLPGRRGWPVMSRLQAGFLVLALAVANAYALRTNIVRYTTGLDIDPSNLDVTVEWWWGPVPSPMRMWVIGSLAMLGALWAAVHLVRVELLTDPAVTVPGAPASDVRAGVAGVLPAPVDERPPGATAAPSGPLDAGARARPVPSAPPAPAAPSAGSTAG